MLFKMVLLGLAISMPSIAGAAEPPFQCPQYSPRDREAVRNVLSGEVPGIAFRGVAGIIGRSSNIAYLGSFAPPIVTLGLQTQREAFENEYQALLALIDQIGSQPLVGLKPRTRWFLRSVVNQSFLGLSGTTLRGANEADARQNADNALSALASANQLLWSCF